VMAKNVTFRDEVITNRPPWNGHLLDFVGIDATLTETHWNTGNFQGAAFYYSVSGSNGIIVSKGGRLFRVTITTNGTTTVEEITIRVPVSTTADFVPVNGVHIFVNTENPISVGDNVFIDGGQFLVTQVLEGEIEVNVVVAPAHNPVVAGTGVFSPSTTQLIWEDTNPDDDYINMLQAERFMLVCNGTTLPIIYDGSRARRSTLTEIPPFYCGAYINGRIWFAFPNRKTFGAGNLVGSVGTDWASLERAVLIYSGPDAENDYLNEGGEFAIPGDAGLITAIVTSSIMDTGLGQGPVTVFTTNGVFTVNAPVDRTVWKDLNYPIQTVALVDQGILATRSAVNINADIWYRSQDGIRSFIVAQRDFSGTWGNTPMSREVGAILDKDTEALLMYASGCIFDNRLLMTCSPHRTQFGVIHRACVALRFDKISSVANKSQPDWEGLWIGPQIHQFVRGRIENHDRCFAIGLGSDDKLQVWELLTEGPYDIQTLKYCSPSIKTHVVVNRIVSSIKTKSFAFENSGLFERKKLTTGEIYVDGLQGAVEFHASFKPDQYPFEVCWGVWNECVTVDRCSTGCPDLANYQPGYRPRMMLPKASEECLPGVGTPANVGYEFSVCLLWNGKANIKKIRLHAQRLLNDSAGECRVDATTL